jgi:hypothetical protein
MNDQEEREFVYRTLVDLGKITGYDEWADDRVARRVQEQLSDLGLTPREVKRLALAHVRQVGIDAVRQVREERPGWREEYRFYYKVVVPFEGTPRGLFIEMRLIDPDPDDPQIQLVNAHLQPS